MIKTRAMLRRATVLVIAAGFAAIPAAAQAAPPPRAELTGIYYNSPGKDLGGNKSVDAEWVGIRNTTRGPITLTRWTLRDTAGHVFVFPAFTLKAGAVVRIHTGKGSNSAAALYWGHAWYIWNNTGDTATLKMPGGVREDSCAYSDPRQLRVFAGC